MTEKFEPCQSEYRQLDPKHINPSELQDMQRLYIQDAVEAYGKIVKDDKTKEAIGLYFKDKAEALSGVILDPNQRFWVVTQGTHIVGMAGCNFARGLIHSVYISAAVRGQGLGSGLMKAVVERTNMIRQTSSRTILVASENERAISFYERLGFTSTGNTKDWHIGSSSILELEMEIKASAS